jgi:hypothetical protein
MRRIYSGLYVHQSSQPATWAGRALSRQLQWCQQQAIEYTFIASPMNAWAKYAAYPWSWTFGTLVKFEAMRDFLDNPSRGNVFIWMDLDVYPETDAKLSDMTDIGENVLWAAMCKPSFCGYPGIDRNHLNMYCKLIWGGSYAKPEYLALNTGMYSLSRSAVADFWKWLNRDFNIDTFEWWDDYNAKQSKCRAFSAKDGHEVDAFSYGSEETLLEQWLNQSSTRFAPFGCDIHGLYDSGRQHKFTHYYGSAKDRYPTW